MCRTGCIDQPIQGQYSVHLYGEIINFNWRLWERWGSAAASFNHVRSAVQEAEEVQVVSGHWSGSAASFEMRLFIWMERKRNGEDYFTALYSTGETFILFSSLVLATISALSHELLARIAG